MIKDIKIFLLSIISILSINYVSAKDISNTNKHMTYVPIREVVAGQGIFQPHNGKCQAEISISGLGGFKILSVRQMDVMAPQEIKDVTGIAWLTDSVLVYTVSPTYGNPGVYIFNCTTKETNRIIAPKNINPTYPDGSDYFELYRVSTDKIYFYYATDVDSVNFREFRSPAFLFQSNLDGSEFKKAVVP